MYEDYDDNQEVETLCQLEDGTITPYDAAHSTDEQVYDPNVYEFIGVGHVYSVGGFLQTIYPDQKDYFYRRVAA